MGGIGVIACYYRVSSTRQKSRITTQEVPFASVLFIWGAREFMEVLSQCL